MTLVDSSSQSIIIERDITPAIISWIKAEFTGARVIIDRPNVPRPKRPYFAILLTTPIQKGGARDHIQHQAGSDTIFEIGGQRRFTVSISVIDEMKNKNFFTVQNACQQLMDSLEDVNRRAPLTAAGLSVWFSTEILDVTELLETGYEPRAQFDLEMGIASNRTADLGAIEKVKVQGTIEGDDEPEFDIPDQP